jgi:hypothetical protein
LEYFIPEGDAHYNQQTKAQGKRSLFDSLAGEIESRLTKLGEINDAVGFHFEQFIELNHSIIIHSDARMFREWKSRLQSGATTTHFEV